MATSRPTHYPLGKNYPKVCSDTQAGKVGNMGTTPLIFRILSRASGTSCVKLALGVQRQPHPHNFSSTMAGDSHPNAVHFPPTQQLLYFVNYIQTWPTIREVDVWSSLGLRT